MSGQARRLALIFLMTFAVVGIGLMLLRGSIQDTVVVPVLYLLWLGRLLFNSLHQTVFWIGMLLLMLVVLGSGLRKRQDVRQPSRPAGGVSPQQNRRVAHWAAQVRHIHDADRWDAASHAEFRKLILSVLAYQAGVSPWEAERDLETGALELPAEARRFLGGETGPAPGEEAAQIADDVWLARREEGAGRRALHRIQALFAATYRRIGWPRDTRAEPPWLPNLQAMIAALENQLEVRDGDGDQPGRVSL